MCHPLFFWLEACSGLEVAGFCGGVMGPKAFAAGDSWNMGLPCICWSLVERDLRGSVQVWFEALIRCQLI